MGRNRLIFCALIAAYLACVDQPGTAQGLIYIGAYGAFSVAALASVHLDARASTPRRIIALVGDFTTIGFSLHSCDAATAVFAPLYLWVILGNGFRFGLPFLAISAVAAIASFSAVAATTAFWQHNGALTSGFLIGLVMLPAYVATLIRKLSRVNAHLLAANHQAQAANKAKGLFLASMSHELRTPLHAITATASHLAGTEMDDSQRELLATLSTSARHLLGLIGDVLDLSSMEASGPRIELVETNLGEMMLEARSMILPGANERSLDLRVELSAALPATVVIDRRLALQILMNLAGNALKFTTSGHVTLSALPGLAPGTLRLEVADTGIGIASEALGAIWGTFAQADSTILDRFGGTGLGLAIVKQIVTSLGGTMGVRSSPGAGSTFWTYLPVSGGTPASTERADNPGAARVAVLLDRVDHELANTLAAFCAEVITAEGIEDAIARTISLHGAKTPAFIVLDRLTARGADATPSALRTVRALGAILVTTKDNEEEDRHQIGLPTWLTNSSTVDEIRSAVRIAAAFGQRAGPRLAPADVSRRSGLRILVADDNKVNRRILEKILAKAGHATVLAEDGEAALDALGEAEFDLVLMDVNMPKMNGLDATKAWRFMEPHGRRTPIIALTADATTEMGEQCRAAGMNTVVTKPVETERLHEIIEATMDQFPPSSPASPAQATREATVPFDVVMPVLDERQQQGLLALGGEEFLRSCCQSFAADAAALLPDLRSAAQDHDLARYRETAHAIKSSGANVGAAAICQFAQAAEALDIAGLGIDGQRIAARLDIEIKRLLKTMNARDQANQRKEPERAV